MSDRLIQFPFLLKRWTKGGSAVQSYCSFRQPVEILIGHIMG